MSDSPLSLPERYARGEIENSIDPNTYPDVRPAVVAGQLQILLGPKAGRSPAIVAGTALASAPDRPEETLFYFVHFGSPEAVPACAETDIQTLVRQEFENSFGRYEEHHDPASPGELLVRPARFRLRTFIFRRTYVGLWTSLGQNIAPFPI